MKQSVNEVFIEGILQSVDLTTGTDKNNKPFIRGNLIINVDQSYGGHDEHEEIKVSVYSGKYKNDGGENPAYKSIEGLNNYKRLSTDGDEADGIRFNRGNISEYAFKPQGADNVVTGWQINNSFFTKVPAASVAPKAVFQNEIFIRELSDEINSAGEETGRLKVVGILVGYNNRADVVTYFVEEKKAIDYISKNWNEGDTVKVGGRIRTCVEMAPVETKQADGFGDEIDMGATRVRRELIITSGSPSNMDKDMSFDEDDIRAAMGERMNRINAVGATSRPASPAAKRANRGW